MKLVCPNCGDNLRYRVKEEDAFCDTCMSSFAIKDLSFSWHDIVSRKCSSCGAEIVTDDEARVLKCEYCGGKEFQTIEFEKGFKPVAIVPFKISKMDAENILHLAMQKSGKYLDNYVEIEEIQHFYVPYSYEYQFFSNNLQEFQKNIGKVKKNDKGNIGHHKGQQINVGENVYHFSVGDDLWDYSDYSQLLFQILPFSFEKAHVLNPIYLDYAYAMNVKQEYVQAFFDKRSPEYYWVPIYKIRFKAPKISLATYQKDDLEEYVMLVNGQTGEYATLYEFLHRENKEAQAQIPEEYISWKKILFTVIKLFLTIQLITICTIGSTALEVYLRVNKQVGLLWCILILISLVMLFFMIIKKLWKK